MANKNIFGSAARGEYIPPANIINNANAPAYAMEDKHALAQLAATGCLNNTFYVGADTQLDSILALAKKVDPRFVAKVAIYSRNVGRMKDMPALLTAWLTTTGMTELFERTFETVITNGKMIRNFMQIMRSGQVGRKSLGTAPRRAVRRWFDTNSGNYIFRNSIGNDPAMADVIKMVHPKPNNREKDALYAYLIHKPFEFEDLPAVVKQFELFKNGYGALPDLPFQFLASQDLTPAQWVALAIGVNWTTLRMNLNTFARHGVFTDKAVVRQLADKLSNADGVRMSGVFPYQLLTAFSSVDADVPIELKNALQSAMEIATENIPTIAGNVYVLIDISGSMNSPVTGYRGTATTATTCVGVAAMMGAAILRKNKHAMILPFNNEARPEIQLNPFDSIMTNAQAIARHVRGGTACQAALEYLNKTTRPDKSRSDIVIMISDNESWFDRGRLGKWTRRTYSDPTTTKKQWEIFKRARPNAKMICVDLSPNDTIQAPDDKDTMNIGGFSDTVFDVIAGFIEAKDGADYWVREIERVKI